METKIYRIILPNGNTVYCEGTNIESKDCFIQVIKTHNGVIKEVVGIYPQGSTCFPISGEDFSVSIEGLKVAAQRLFDMSTLILSNKYSQEELTVARSAYEAYMDRIGNFSSPGKQ